MSVSSISQRIAKLAAMYAAPNPRRAVGFALSLVFG